MNQVFAILFQVSLIISSIRIILLTTKILKKLPGRSCKDFDYFYLVLFVSKVLTFFVITARQLVRAFSLSSDEFYDNDGCHPHFIVFIYTIQSASCVYLSTNWAEIAGL